VAEKEEEKQKERNLLKREELKSVKVANAKVRDVVKMLLYSVKIYLLISGEKKSKV
tara:strand:+ start:32 stop:199 length:168 start_codon:yes stop_codon:yes gene_type:complete